MGLYKKEKTASHGSKLFTFRINPFSQGIRGVDDGKSTKYIKPLKTTTEILWAVWLSDLCF